MPSGVISLNSAPFILVVCLKPRFVFQVSSSEYFSVNFECGVLATAGDDQTLPAEEFVPATKGTSLS
jgi:hypothetical protein